MRADREHGAYHLQSAYCLPSPISMNGEHSSKDQSQPNYHVCMPTVLTHQDMMCT